MNPKVLRRLTIFGLLIGAFVFIDGLVLLFTNGLTSDATPIFPVLGFAKTRSSGASVVILGVAILVLTVVGRWWMGRRAAQDETTDTGMVETPGAADHGNASVAETRYTAAALPNDRK